VLPIDSQSTGNSAVSMLQAERATRIDRGNSARCRVKSLTAALAVLSTSAIAEDDAAKRQFLTSCGVCHTAAPGAPHRQGPNLAGILGRKAATISGGFKYSSVLARSTLIWDEATLDRWIEDAQAMLPGTTMAYRQRDPDKRKAIIAYLKSLNH
jgi:cytochrome c